MGTLPTKRSKVTASEHTDDDTGRYKSTDCTAMIDHACTTDLQFARAKPHPSFSRKAA